VYDVTPLPATLPLFATGLGAFGLLGWRRKRKKAVAAGRLMKGLELKATLLGVIAALALFCSFPIGTARANSLTGDVISGSYDFPCDTCTYSNFTFSVNPFVVNGGVGLSVL